MTRQNARRLPKSESVVKPAVTLGRFSVSAQ